MYWFPKTTRHFGFFVITDHKEEHSNKIFCYYYIETSDMQLIKYFYALQMMNYQIIKVQQQLLNMVMALLHLVRNLLPFLV